MRAGLSPAEFWELTHHEVHIYLAGRADARQDELRLFAWHAANIMQMWTKQRLSAGKLLGEKRELTELYTSVAEIKEHYRNRSKNKPE